MTAKETFLNYLRYEKNRSSLTVNHYDRDLRCFEEYFKHIEERLTWNDVDGDVIRDWISQMMDRGMKATTINAKLSAVKSFYRFALSRGIVTGDPSRLVSGPKTDKPLPQFVREKDMDRLLDDMSRGDNYPDVCSYTIILVFYETGIRLAELISLDLNDIDLARMELRVTGKRDKQRVVPFGSELAAALRTYLSIRAAQFPSSTTSALFLGTKGRRISRAAVQNQVRGQLRRVCSLKRCSPHVLRHTFATVMLNNGCDLESVRLLLGHASIATTEIYTHTTFAYLKEEYARSNPRKNYS